ncbi:MAG: guanylate kinase [Candidatus Omnitrophica bacterium]|nr:guanylate kinase [Candidatus Omnitrophota bacterium]MBD3269385.1 guanylate kinase [Candidatus Omnitrophota bacterium]
MSRKKAKTDKGRKGNTGKKPRSAVRPGGKDRKQKKAKTGKKAAFSAGNNTKIFILSGPGGVGKTTLSNSLFRKKGIKSRVIKGITVTTRKQRPGEAEGKDYFFVSKEDFLKLKKNNFFLETQKVLNCYYGTPRILYTLAEKLKKSLLLCIDVKGALYLKKQFKAGKIITIFLTAPREKELYKRMRKRDESKEIIKKRIELAKKELSSANKYDYVLTNKNINSTINNLQKIILENIGEIC